MQFLRADVERLGSILSEVMQNEVMPRFRRHVAGEERQKSSAFDVVTEADECAEAAIGAALSKAYPSGVVIGEEATHANPGLLSAIEYSELAFIVDPLDGTKNFVAGLPLFGAMIAVTVRGEVVAGAIHDPVCRNSAFALRHNGAWLVREGGSVSELRVAEPTSVSNAEGIVGTTFLPQPVRDIVNGNLSRLATSTWLRCAAHEYRMAASAQCHLLLYNKLMPWDHAAGWLLHKEAGGYSAHFDGSQYRPSDLTGGLLLAPDESSWRAFHAALLTPRQS